MFVPQLEETLVEEKVRRNTSVPAGTPVGDVVKLMREENVGSVAILNEDKKLVGLFTERNLLSRVLLTQLEPTTPIDEVMIKEVVAVQAKSSMDFAFVVAYKKNFRYIPVVDEEHRFVGFLEARDFVRMLDIFGSIYTTMPDNELSVENREGA